MKHQIYLLSLFLSIIVTTAEAQTKIGGLPGQANANAYLQIGDSATANKGLLMPRVKLSATNVPAPLVAHVAGMYVYNIAAAGSGSTAVIPGLYYNDGVQWIQVANATNKELLFGSNAPAIPCEADKIYTDTLSTSATVGQQWVCSSGAWVPYVSPAQTEWNIANTTIDAGSSKTADIYRNGRVGIFTNKPLVAFHVGGESDIVLDGINPIYISRSTQYQPSGNIVGGLGYVSEGSATTTVWPSQASVLFVASEAHTATAKGTNILFYTAPNGSTLAFPRMNISNNGNVGIATTTPSATLDVKGSQAVNVTTVTGISYNVGTLDYFIIGGATTTVTLPPANAARGRVLIIKSNNSPATVVTIQAAAGDVMDGENYDFGNVIHTATTTVGNGYRLTLISDGVSTWHIH